MLAAANLRSLPAAAAPAEHRLVETVKRFENLKVEPIRVATYAMKNSRAMKQLADVAASIIEYYEQFLRPFPFSEFNILKINAWGIFLHARVVEEPRDVVLSKPNGPAAPDDDERAAVSRLHWGVATISTAA